MYKGSVLWGKRIPLPLVKKTLSNGREIETFRDLPETMYGALLRSAEKNPDKCAIEDDLGRVFTYRELVKEVDLFAACLVHKFQMKKGDHVGLMLYGSSEFGIAFLALVKIGAVAVVLPTKYQEQEIDALVEHADLQYILCDTDFEEWFRKYKTLQIMSCKPQEGELVFHSLEDIEGQAVIDEQGGYEDPVVMMFTSGTTSQSKGVILTNYNFLHAAAAYQACFHITSDDSAVIPVPTYMITGLSALFGLFIYAGGTIYMHRFFKADKVLKCIQDKHVTFMHAAPTVYTLLLEEWNKFPKLPSLRCLACGGSRMQKEKIEKIHEWLPHCEFHTVYGMTETTSPGTILPENAIESKHMNSSGIPIPGLNYKIVDENGKELQAGETGEIMVSGANIMAGYYKMDSGLYQNWWLKTGDVGYFTDEGYCYVLDRKKDMINRGGEKITSIDVENVLYQIPGIAEAAVVGIPHKIYGETPVALIQLEKDISVSSKEITEYLKKKLAKYKIPSEIRFTEAIPLTPNGKIDKKKIRKIFIEEEKQETI
ncbi:Long-chain-fatty-acid--CoA ligase [Dorea longicatena]|uniref:Long-chain-fatty-acid--CoA ligase n=1 Tax=Dorea longicatena TaxID=88431 RepID=A0A564SLP1_9FIRM|nr:class I adenylate-forming enzyme family protein [Dorea longicatena]VUW95330.1 Long-chain-fatty-acid--CoA ligase [Dorea longicatena]